MPNMTGNLNEILYINLTKWYRTLEFTAFFALPKTGYMISDLAKTLGLIPVKYVEKNNYYVLPEIAIELNKYYLNEIRKNELYLRFINILNINHQIINSITAEIEPNNNENNMKSPSPPKIPKRKLHVITDFDDEINENPQKRRLIKIDSDSDNESKKIGLKKIEIIEISDSESEDEEDEEDEEEDDENMHK